MSTEAMRAWVGVLLVTVGFLSFLCGWLMWHVRMLWDALDTQTQWNRLQEELNAYFVEQTMPPRVRRWSEEAGLN